MDKAILMSATPNECCNILNLLQSLLVRKKFPPNYRGWVYIYCTKNENNKLYFSTFHGKYMVARYVDYKHKVLNGKVVARFYVNNVMYYLDKGTQHYYNGLTHDKMMHIIDNCCESLSPTGNKYFIIMSQLEIFDKSKELWQFGKYGSLAPKNWQYVEVEN